MAEGSGLRSGKIEQTLGHLFSLECDESGSFGCEGPLVVDERLFLLDGLEFKLENIVLVAFITVRHFFWVDFLPWFKSHFLV